MPESDTTVEVEPTVEATVEPTVEPTVDMEAQQDATEDAWLEANDSDEEEVGIEAAAEEAAPAEAPNETAQDAPPEDIKDAYAILRRDGWDAEDLNTLDPERILAMAEKRGQVQGDYDRAYQKLKALEAGETTEGDVAESEGVADTAEAPSGQPAQDIAEMVAPLAEHLALDDEGTEALVSFQKAVMGPLTESHQVQSRLLEQAVGAILGMQEETARNQLGDRFPQLRDASSEAYQAVQARMGELHKTGEYDSVASLMEAAASVELAPQARADVERANDTVNLFQANGQPSTEATPPEPGSGPMDTDALESHILDLLESGDPNAVAKARALSGR